MATDLRRELEKHGWRIRYVPHEVIADYNACYRVVYRGKVIHPPAADRLGIPLNEVWLSERLRDYEEYVLFHELKEIGYRCQGYSVEEAHLRARIEEALRYCNDPKWVEYFRKFPDYSVPLNCLKEICNAIENGVRDIDALYEQLMKCANRDHKHCQAVHRQRGSNENLD